MLIVLGMAAPSAAGQTACSLPTVLSAIFNDLSDACDRNGDGNVGAADVVEAIVPRPSPTATPTAATATPTPTLTAGNPLTATPTPTATRTPTPLVCPTSGAGLRIEIDNQTGSSPISVVLTGERAGEACRTGALATSYSLTRDCTGTGIIACGEANGLAPGVWRHSIRVLIPQMGQLQHQTSLLVADATPNALRFTAFASVRSVTTTANTGDGSLRSVLQSADSAAKPLLIQFAAAAFPPGEPTAITLQFQLPALASDDVTIDGTDAGGAVGNRIIDAAGLPIPAFTIAGARNRLIGLRLRNAGDNNRDVLTITGPAADGNVVERVIIQGAATGDGVGVDMQAGKDFAASANVIRDCEVSGASDKGIKVTTGAYARVERCWVHDNVNGGIQATLGGHVQAWHNLVERNRGGTAQNGLSSNARDEDESTGNYSEMRSWGNIARGNGANGFSVRGFAFAHVRDDYLATNASSGLRVFNDVGPAATALVEGTSAVCNAVDGAVVANTSIADCGGGVLASAGDNAFAQNNLPGGGANLRNATGAPVSAINAQWEHCGRDATCDDDAIASFDVSDHGVNTTFSPAQAHRSRQPPVLTAVAAAVGKQGELLRIFGSGFNVIDGHFAEDNCADVTGRNRCVPLRGNCVRINGISAPVEAVTPTMLVVRWPFTCIAPVSLVVTTDQGSTGASSTPLTVCTNAAPNAADVLQAAELRFIGR